jgi:hypothetical protein
MSPYSWHCKSMIIAISGSRRKPPFGEKSGAANNDCAAPHENPNLTLNNLTVASSFRSIRNQTMSGRQQTLSLLRP